MESTEVKMVGLTRSTCGLSEAQVQLVMAIGEEKVCVGHYSTCFLFPCVAKLPCKKLVSVFFFFIALTKAPFMVDPRPPPQSDLDLACFRCIIFGGVGEVVSIGDVL